MVGTTPIDVVAATTTPVVAARVEGDPKQFVLRGNVECERLLNTLARSGVTGVRCFGRTRNGDNAEVFAAMPDFRDGIDVSTCSLERVRHMAASLSYLIWCAACEAVAQVSAEGCDLLVDALVVVDGPTTSPRIHADVTVIEADDPKLVEWEIQLL